VERAALELGLRPLIALQHGIKHTCNWYRAGGASQASQSKESVAIADRGPSA
jgi:hypothetical protein